MTFSLVAENPESMVVAEYQSPYRKDNTFQSKAELEKAFVEQFQTQAYEIYHEFSYKMCHICRLGM